MTGRAILLADRFRMECRILNAASLYFKEIHVVGASDAAWLKYSRYCSAFFDLGKPFSQMGPLDAGRIDDYAKAHRISCILPTGAHTTRFLATYHDCFETPCFPVHSRDAFDILNNKFTFYGLCLELGLPVPSTRKFETWAELRAAVLSKKVIYPFVIKPLALDGGLGVKKINNLDDFDKSAKYKPIIVQDFIEGQDMSTFYLCRDGDIVGGVSYIFDTRGIRFIQRLDVDNYIRVIAARFALNGVVGFDFRERSDGQIFFIESNPRFWFRMDVMALAGLDFVRAALTKQNLSEGPPEGLEARSRGRLLKAAILPWRLNWLERRILGNLLRDPLPPLLEFSGRARLAGPTPPREQSVISISANVTPCLSFLF